MILIADTHAVIEETETTTAAATAEDVLARSLQIAIIALETTTVAIVATAVTVATATDAMMTAIRAAPPGRVLPGSQVRPR